MIFRRRDQRAIKIQSKAFNEWAITVRDSRGQMEMIPVRAWPQNNLSWFRRRLAQVKRMEANDE